MEVMNQLLPVLVELVKAGKAIGLAYFAVIGLVPVVTVGVKGGLVYAVIRCICETVLKIVSILYVVEEKKHAKK